ncbi:MAG: hypothetical protein PHD17_00735 [Methanothrix soehngenii]|jgi:hypothetical protein|nr:hypothetical protein [Methanothrix soehngenii]
MQILKEAKIYRDDWIFSIFSQIRKVSNVAVPMSFGPLFHPANEFLGDLAWREVAAGDPGDHLRDQHAEAIRIYLRKRGIKSSISKVKQRTPMQAAEYSI